MYTDNDAFDFGGLHTSKPKDHHHNNSHNSNNNSNGKKNKKNKNRINKNKNLKSKAPLNNHISHHHNSNNNNDDFYSSSSSANSHSYSGISMPSYTHEFTVSNSDQKDVYLNPAQGSASGPNHQNNHHQQVHYESLPFKYPSSAVHDSDNEYVGHASSQNNDFSQYNWSPSVTDFGSSSSAFSLPTSQFNQGSSVLTGAESAQIGPVFRPPRKNPPAPFHGKKKGGSHGAPRAGPRRPQRNNQGESFHRGPGPAGKMAGHQQQHRPEVGGYRAAASNPKGYVHHSRPRPLMSSSATEQKFETVMMPPVPGN